MSLLSFLFLEPFRFAWWLFKVAYVVILGLVVLAIIGGAAVTAVGFLSQR